MSPAISKRDAKALLKHLAPAVVDGDREALRLSSALHVALRVKLFLASARKRKGAKLRSKKSETRDIRAAVFARAGGWCECGVGVHGSRQPLQMDHFHGGSNRKSLESVEGCWMLSWTCHEAKGRGLPSRSAWIQRFLAHSKLHGYDAEPQRKARRDLASLELQGRS